MRQPPPRPTTRSTVLIAIALSVLPGLGHAYAMRLPRAIIWFGGTIVIGLVLREGAEGSLVRLVMPAVLSAAAAIDVALVMWLDRRSTRRS